MHDSALNNELFDLEVTSINFSWNYYPWIKHSGHSNKGNEQRGSLLLNKFSLSAP